MLAFEWLEGGGVPVTLLHGFPVDRTMWQPTVQALAAAGHDVLTPDLRGFGQSAAAPTASMAEMAADVLGVWDHLGIDQGVVAGFSMGGYVALRMVLDHPGRVTGLALVSTRAEADALDAVERRRRGAEELEARGQAAVADLAAAMLPGQLTPASLGTPVADRLREMMLRQRAPGVAAALRGMAARPDVTRRLGDIPCPALVVVGDADSVTPLDPCARTLADGLRRSRLEVVAGAAHMVPLEQPGAWCKALTSWLDTSF